MQSTEGTAVQRLESGAYRVSARSAHTPITDRYVAAATGSRDARLLTTGRRSRG